MVTKHSGQWTMQKAPEAESFCETGEGESAVSSQESELLSLGDFSLSFLPFAWGSQGCCPVPALPLHTKKVSKGK